jgi:hypothetical protein
MGTLIGNQAMGANIYDITTGAEDHWISTYDNAGAGTVVLSGAQPRSGLGSVKFDTTGAGDRARLGTFPNPGNNFGSLGVNASNITAASYDWRVDSSTTAPNNLNPFYKLYVSGSSLTWEFSNETAGAAPTDSWQTTDMTTAKFWIRQGTVNFNQATNMHTLAEWANGQIVSDGLGHTSSALSAATNISGLETGVGTGWSGTFTGFVDNMVLITTGGANFNDNFEVPEPASLGFVALGGLMLMRRQRRAKAV